MTRMFRTGGHRGARRVAVVAAAATVAAGLISAGVALTEAPASAAAASNTLVVNANQVLRPVTHVATGSLYGLANATQPSVALAQAIKPNTFVQMPSGGKQQPDGNILVVAPTAAAVGAKLVDRLSDYYAGWPYQFSWSTWTPFINSQIAAMKASSYYSSITAYEPWNESDGTWLSANGTYEAFWTTTYRQIRTLDATKPIQGPSFSDNISDMKNFLTNAVSTNTVPDIISWHELSSASKIAGDVATVTALETSLGITPRPIAIEEYAAPAEVGLPGPLVSYVSKFERLGIHDAELAFWNQSGALGDLLTSKGGSPNAAYWMYTWYAAMSGNMVVTTPPAQTGIDGFASVPSGNNPVSIVAGNCSGSCAVTVNGLNLGNTVTVKVEQTASLGRTVASSGATTVSTATYTPSNGTISVPITMVTNNAYRITITGTGTTPTTSPATTTSPAPTTSPATTTTPATTTSSAPTTTPAGTRTCTAAYAVTSSWTGGFVANVTVAAGSTSISGWRVTLNLPSGAAIANIWNGVNSGTTGTVTVSNASYNGAVSAGQSASFGFQGTGSGSGATVSCTAS